MLPATGRQHRRCIIRTTSCKTHTLVLLKMGKITARNMLGWLELLINRYCCIWLVVYFIVLVTHGHTNIKCSGIWRRAVGLFPDGVAAEKFTLFKERFLCSCCSQDTQFVRNTKTDKKDILRTTHFDNDSRPTFCPTRVSLALKVGQSVLLPACLLSARKGLSSAEMLSEKREFRLRQKHEISIRLALIKHEVSLRL